MMTRNIRAYGRPDFEAKVAVETLPADGMANNELHLGTLCHRACYFLARLSSELHQAPDGTKMATIADRRPAASCRHIWEPIATSSRSSWPSACYTLKNIESRPVLCGVLEYRYLAEVARIGKALIV
jgi:hypothetical protein